MASFSEWKCLLSPPNTIFVPDNPFHVRVCDEDTILLLDCFFRFPVFSPSTFLKIKIFTRRHLKFFPPPFAISRSVNGGNDVR